MNTFYFFKADWKFIFNITSGIGIVSQLHMIMKTISFSWNAKTQMPFHSFFFPGFIPFFLRTWTNEILHFHLLKLPHTKNKLPRYNFIPERLPYLCNTERNF